MALEGKDINDSAIIDQTQQLRNAQGKTQFKITLPSGRELESEWLSEDNVKKALWPWVDTVRNEMVADAEEQRAQARRLAASRPKAPALVSVSGDALSVEPPQSVVATVPSGLQTRLPMPVAQPSVSTVSPTAGAVSTPDQFARQGLEQARKDADYWQGVAQGAMGKWQEASANVEKWERILAAMNGLPGGIQVVSNDHSGDSRSQPGVTSRRGRKPGSKNKPKPSMGSVPLEGAAGRIIVELE